MTRLSPLAIAVLAIALLAGCSESDATGNDNQAIGADGVGGDDPGADTIGDPNDAGPGTDPTLAAIDTAVSPSQVPIGGEVEIACTGTDDEGVELTFEGATVTITPDTGVTQEAVQADPAGLLFSWATFGTPGIYEVACAAGEITDDTPATVTVTAGPATHVATILDPSTILAGETAMVTCTLTDAEGNPAEGTATIGSDHNELTFDEAAMTVTATVAGTFEVTCAVEGAESESAELTVEMGPAVELVLVVSPDIEPYDVGYNITVTGEIVDEYGNTGTTDIAGLTAAPEGHHVVVGENNNLISFTVDGEYAIIAHADGDPSLADDIVVKVDTFGPIFDIHTPGRGAYVEGDPTIQILGSVHDNPGGLVGSPTDPQILVSLGEPCNPAPVVDECPTGFTCDIWPGIDAAWQGEYVCYLALPVDGKGDFNFTLDLDYGINHVSFEATDAYDHTSTTTTAIVWSSAYYGMDPPSVEVDSVHNALTLQLGQDLLDDGVHPHDDATEELNDIASILELVLGEIDLADAVTGPLVSGTFPVGLWTIEAALVADTFVLSNPHIALELGNGSLTVTFEAHDITATVDAELYTELVPGVSLSAAEGSTSGTLLIEYLKIVSTLELAIDATGQLTAHATDNVLDFGDITATFDPITLSAFGFPSAPIPVDLLNTGLETILTGLSASEEFIELVVPIVIEATISDVLGGIASELSIDQTVNIPAFVDGMNATNLQLQGTVDSLDITPSYLLMGVEAMASAPDATEPYASPGSIDFSGCDVPTVPALDNDEELKAALHDDLFNQLMYAIWTGRTLQFELGAEEIAGLELEGLPIDLQGLSVDPSLPFVFNGCTENLTVQVGDLYIDAVIGFLGDNAHIGVWVNGNIDIAVTAIAGAEGTELGVEITGYDAMRVDVEVNEGLLAGDDATLQVLLSQQLLPLIFDSVLEDYSVVSLPSIDLSTLSPAIPAGTELSFDLESIAHGPETTASEPDAKDGNAYTIIEGGL